MSMYAVNSVIHTMLSNTVSQFYHSTKTVFLLAFDTTEFLKTLNSLKKKNSAGHDKISSKFLGIAASVIFWSN